MNKVFEMGGDLITQDLTNKFISSIGEYQKQEDGEKFRESKRYARGNLLAKNPNKRKSHRHHVAKDKV